MKKFTNMNENSGHKGVNGEWEDETPQAKIRNKLSPFWTLSDILSNDKYIKMLSTDDGRKIIQDLVKQCELNKSKILDLLKESENKK